MISWNLENGKANKAERFDYDQVMLFGIMAIEIKRKAPYAHTVCEIVKARYVAFFFYTDSMIIFHYYVTV